MFIQIKDGQPHEHPIMDWNFREAFPDIDIDNLPSQFANFERVECDIEVGLYEVAEVSYQWVGNAVKDVWSKRPMTNEEKLVVDEQLAAAAREVVDAAFRSTDVSGTEPNVII